MIEKSILNDLLKKIRHVFAHLLFMSCIRICISLYGFAPDFYYQQQREHFVRYPRLKPQGG